MSRETIRSAFVKAATGLTHEYIVETMFKLEPIDESQVAVHAVDDVMQDFDAVMNEMDAADV